MKKHTKSIWIMRMLLIAGAIEILVGFVHFIMPIFAYKSPGFNLLSESEIDFISLSVYAVGMLLVAFGSLTIVISFKTESWKVLLLPFLTINSLLWCARVGLEIIYPATISLFYFQRPTTVVTPLLIFEALLFSVPAVYIWTNSATWEIHSS